MTSQVFFCDAGQKQDIGTRSAADQPALMPDYEGIEVRVQAVGSAPLSCPRAHQNINHFLERERRGGFAPKVKLWLEKKRETGKPPFCRLPSPWPSLLFIYSQTFQCALCSLLYLNRLSPKQTDEQKRSLLSSFITSSWKQHHCCNLCRKLCQFALFNVQSMDLRLQPSSMHEYATFS